jgi:hypothetical protein
VRAGGAGHPVAALRRPALVGLPADVRRVATVLGLYPGPAPDAGAVAALAGLSRAATRTALTWLVRAGLAVEAGDRYRPLVEPPAPPDADACRERLRQHLLATASAACAVAAARGPAVALPPFHSAAAARAWLEAERPTLLALADPGFAARLVPWFAAYLDATGRGADAAMLRARVRPPAPPRPGGRDLLDRARRCAARGRRVEALAWFAEAYERCALAGDRIGRDEARRGLDAALTRRLEASLV